MSTFTLKGHIVAGSANLLVSATCVERPDLELRYSISTGQRRDLAERLVRAIDAGAVFTNLMVLRDVHGKEYLSGTCNVIGRRLNADLKRLGF